MDEHMASNPISFKSELTLSSTTIFSKVFELTSFIRPDWSPSNTRLVPFVDGLTNMVFGIFDLRTNDASPGLVVKIFGNQTHLVLDRQNEREVILALASRQLAKPLLVEFGNGVIYDFTPGEVCSREDIRRDDIRALIACKLAQFHSVPLSDEQRKKGPCLIPFIRKIVAFLEQQGKASKRKEVALLIADIDIIEQSILPRLQPDPDLVLCHNDLQSKNFLYDPLLKSISLIDFEYAQANYAFYDLAEHFVEYAGVHDPDYSIYPTREEQLHFLRIYFDKRGVRNFDEEKLLRIVNQFSALPHFLWSLWAFAQANISSVSFDYIKCAQMHFDMYQKLKPNLFDEKL